MKWPVDIGVMTVEQLVDYRQYVRDMGGFAQADALRKMLEDKGVYIEDGKRVVYLPQGVTVKQFLEQEEKDRTATKRFLSWVNSELARMKRPAIRYEEFMRW